MHNNIAKLRKERGISQKGLAEALNVDKTYISKIENGDTPISVKRALEIAEVLKCSLDEMFKEENYD